MISKPVQSKHLISVHQPQLWIASFLVILCLIGLMVWAAFEFGRHEAGFDQTEYDMEIELLRKSLDEQTSKKEEALRENARLSRGSDIQKDASGKISETLAACEDERLKMKEELTFYHNVVAPKKSKREIQVNKVAFESTGNGSYKYKLVLIQVGRHDYVQRGYVELSFEGRKADGSLVRLDLPTVSIGKTTKRQKLDLNIFKTLKVVSDFLMDLSHCHYI